MPTVYDIERAEYGQYGIAGLTAKQLESVLVEMDKILANLTRGWAALYAEATVAKAEAKVEIAKVKADLDALRGVRPSDESAVGSWGTQAADIQGRLHGLAVGLADAPLAASIAGMDPLADLDAALTGSSGGWLKWILLGGGALGAIVFLPRIWKSLKGSKNRSVGEYEPEDALD